MEESVGPTKKRPAHLPTGGDLAKKPKAPGPLFSNAEDDSESAEELTRLLEGPDVVPFKVRFVPYPYTWRQSISPPSSGYITINVGHEESCGSSFSDSDCSLMASVDLGGLNIADGGARGRTAAKDSCGSWDWDDLDEALANFIGE